jgi:predicted HicB family RNase H-like nuclease
MMMYKGYTGHVQYDHEAGIFHGKVLDLKDVITFAGKSVEEIEGSFRSSIDEYLEFCEHRGEEPDKPFSGRLMLRLPPTLHRKVYISAAQEGKSLNQWICEKLERDLF